MPLSCLKKWLSRTRVVHIRTRKTPSQGRKTRKTSSRHHQESGNACSQISWQQLGEKLYVAMQLIVPLLD